MQKVLVIADAAWVVNDVHASIDAPRRRIIDEADPRRAVDQAETNAPEVIIVDMQVGSMGGMALIRALKDAIHTGRIEPARLILLLDRSADEFIAKRAGADAWVVKPFTAQELRSALEHAQPARA